MSLTNKRALVTGGGTGVASDVRSGGISIPQGDDFEELNRMMYGDDVMDACVRRTS